MGKEEPLFTVGGSVNLIYPLWKSVWRYLKRLQIEQPYHTKPYHTIAYHTIPYIPYHTTTRHIYPKNSISDYRDIYTSMLLRHLQQEGNGPSRKSINSGMKNENMAHTPSGILLTHKRNKIIKSTRKQMDSRSILN